MKTFSAITTKNSDRSCMH